MILSNSTISTCDTVVYLGETIDYNKLLYEPYIISDRAKDFVDGALRQILKCIHNNIAKNVKEKDKHKDKHIKLSTISEVFPELEGKTPKDYLKSKLSSNFDG